MHEVLRQEKKFLIDLPNYYQLSHRLAQIMPEDPHNHGDGYPIRSLYYDSLDDRDYEEKEDGVELRRKIRLRCYSPDADFAVLEMKQKQGAMQKKRSLRLPRADAARLIARDYSPLLQSGSAFARECYVIMQTQCYLPRAVVEYRRRAFIAKENAIRITFDHHIIGTESNLNIFSPALPQYSVLDPGLVVLEVKYNGFLLSYLKDVLNECGASESSVGKYCLARTVSRHYRF